MDRATFLLTFDTELLWGLMGAPSTDSHVDAVRYMRREGFARLLGILDELQVPATFALVGHLLVPSDKVGVAESWMADGRVRDRAGEPWYQAAAKRLTKQRDGYYWPELVELLQSADQKHEIASHSLTHCVFDSVHLPAEIAAFEVNRSVELIGEAFGRRPTAFVFPRNHPGHFPQLRNAGISVFRGTDQTWWHRLPGRAGQIGHMADRLLAWPPPVYPVPLLSEGLTNVPGSMLLLTPLGFRRHIPPSCRRMQAERGIRAAVQRRGIFHLWTHPIDLGHNQGALLPVLQRILRRMAEDVAEGKACFRTMSSVAECGLD